MLQLTINQDTLPETIEITDDEIITFPNGLVGCAAWRRFVLLSDDEIPGLHTFYCLDDSRISFLVTDPFLVEPAYRAAISPTDLGRIGLDQPEDAVLLCILTTHTDPVRITANLLGPLILNPRAQLGVQLVLIDSSYTTRHPLQLASATEGEAASCSY